MSNRNLGPQFYHGTNVDHLEPGDEILPAASLGVEGEGHDYVDARGRTLYNTSERVYATSDRRQAEAYADVRARMRGGNPAVYRVHFPEGSKRGFESREHVGTKAVVTERL